MVAPGTKMDDRQDQNYPKRFGRWRVMAPLAQGGMGAVYLAEDESGQVVVVKTIRPELAADPAYRARFRSEAQAALRVRSNFVARVWDCDAVADPPWIAMEKIDGPTLAELVAGSGPMDNVTLMAFAADLAEGIHAFYDQGMAHGDLTPSNIVIQDGNRLKILDLGLTRPTADETATSDLPTMGTPYWLAPEVTAGFAPDNHSDVNQWAKLVLFAGTGYPESGSRGLRDALARLPSPLQNLIERCISPIPDARPPPDDLWTMTRERRLSGTARPMLALSATFLSITPGSAAETTAVATNRTAESDLYRFEVLGPLREWATIVPTSATVPPLDQVDVGVRFELPMGSAVLPGDCPFAVRCAAGNDDSGSTVAEGTITVNSVTAVELQLFPNTPRGRWTGTYSVLLHNNGNSPARLRLAPPEPNERLSFAISPPTVDLSPGDSAVSLVKVRARHPSLIGRPVEHTFCLDVSCDNATTVTYERGERSLNASFRQLSVLPRSLTAIVLSGLLLATVLAAVLNT
jgi:serine/threonine protein kinase